MIRDSSVLLEVGIQKSRRKGARAAMQLFPRNQIYCRVRPIGRLKSLLLASCFWLLFSGFLLLSAGLLIHVSPGMDTFATPWIANLTDQPVEFSLTDSRNMAGSFQLMPRTILQYSVGPQEIKTLSVVRPSGRTEFYDQSALQRLRLRSGAAKDYLLILPDSVQFVSRQEFKSRLAEFKRVNRSSQR
jgi:hypothetical protein